MGRWGGRVVVSFTKMGTFARAGVLLCEHVQLRGEGWSKKGQFYANVIIEWPLIRKLLFVKNICQIK